MAVIVVLGYKGGVTKTTTAICLATLFAQEGRRSLVIDSDPNRSASVWARRGFLPFQVAPDTKAPAILRKESFDHVLIDTQARPSPDEVQELAEDADLIILPTTPKTLAIDALGRIVQVLPKDCNYKVLVAAIPPAPQTDGQDAQKELRDEGLPVFSQLIRSYKAYEHAVAAGTPLYKVPRQGGIAWRDWQNLRKEITL